MNDIILASNKNVSKYISSSKNLYFSNADNCYILKTRDSNVIFDFSSVQEKLQYIIFKMKKISGNGIFFVNIDNFIKKYRISQNITEIKIPYKKNIRIFKTEQCLGEIGVVDIHCTINPNIVENLVVENVAIEQTVADESNIAKKVINTKLYNSKSSEIITYKNNLDVLKGINNSEEDILLIVDKFICDTQKYNLFKKTLQVYNIKAIEIQSSIDENYIYYYLNKSKYIICSTDFFIKKYDSYDNKKVFLYNNRTLKDLNANIYSNLCIEEIADKILYPLEDKKQKMKNDVKFKIIIPSYNTEKWLNKTFDSIISQTYSNYDVCIIDDYSTDENQRNIIKNYCDKYNNENNKWKFIFNNERKYSMCNIYNSIMSFECNDDDVIIILDGDDWLYDDKVLNKLNNSYTENDIYLTYGQYISYPSNIIGHCREISKDIINKKLYRKTDWVLSHLKTFKFELFRQINQQDFFDNNGQFIKMTCDLAIMLPIAEMANGKIMFIPDILYVYNRETPINDDKVNVREQARIAEIIRNRKTYEAKV